LVLPKMRVVWYDISDNQVSVGGSTPEKKCSKRAEGHTLRKRIADPDLLTPGQSNRSSRRRDGGGQLLERTGGPLQSASLTAPPGGGAKVGILPSGKGGTIPAGGGGGPCKGDRERCLNLERCSMNENKKKDKKKNAYGLPLGMCMGLAVGTAIGAATDNIGLWMSIGLSAGLCLGLTLGHSGEEDNGEHTDDKQ